MIIFQSDEMSIVSGANIKTGQLEIQWNFYQDYMILSPENLRSMLEECLQKLTGIIQ